MTSDGFNRSQNNNDSMTSGQIDKQNSLINTNHHINPRRYSNQNMPQQDEHHHKDYHSQHDIPQEEEHHQCHGNIAEQEPMHNHNHSQQEQVNHHNH